MRLVLQNLLTVDGLSGSSPSTFFCSKDLHVLTDDIDDDDVAVRRIDDGGMPIADYADDDDVDSSGTEGGGVEIDVADDADDNFYENLAESMDEHDLSSIALDLLDLIE